MPQDNVLIAFGLTLFAGLATGIGSAMAFFAKKTNKKFLSVALGFSAGVMVYISFIEILPKAQKALLVDWGENGSRWIATLAFFSGILVIAIIDKLVPSFENPHEIHRIEEQEDKKEAAQYRKLYRMGVFTALIIAIHNFPEGLATFAAALSDPKLGIAIAVAIAIHNIPEGIAVSIPIYFATGSKKKAFLHSFLSGLAEPVGAAIGYFLIMPYLSDTVLGIIFGCIAGIMVFISFDELFPTAREYGEHHLVIYGLVGGMGLMALSLLLFL